VVRTLALGVVTAATLGTLGTFHLARTLDDTERIDTGGALREVIPPDKTENYLLVGSDTRETSDPSSPDFGGIGDANDVTGRRSDTMMILRFDPATGQAGLLSLPRDLWLPIDGGSKNRLNSAYAESEQALIRTINQELGIPIDHYVEVDFVGFKRLVDSIGGVNVWFDLPTRDKNTGLDITEPGCHRLDGVQALAYVRSRHFEQRLNGDWSEDPTSDLGRMSRQQDFLRRALNRAVEQVSADPLQKTGEMVDIGQDAVRVDEELDLLGLAHRFVELGTTELRTYSLPVEADEIDGNAVLLLDEEEALPLLAWFAGDSSLMAAAMAEDMAAAAAAASTVPGALAPTTTVPLVPETQPPVGVVPDAAHGCT
jgi:LCP family protein required for cell wall assembly